MPEITVIVPAYQNVRQLHVFVGCMLCQTFTDWQLLIMHDGPAAWFDNYVHSFQDERIDGFVLDENAGDYGHTPRASGLDQVETPWVLLSGSDNYYVPTFLQKTLLAAAEHDADMVLFNAVHNSHGGRENFYHLVDVALRRGQIDIGSFIVRTEIAQSVGYNHRDYAADWHFVEEMLTAGELNIIKLPEVLYVHN